ncbi:unnamed protein product [Heligmosomoides polygyrus]|uniref:Secreted protein n=1 Tax=Heligmosomoides polygyrus TaxID=6339 RepID=A0A183FX88_HELPZ|nr:unnamed protein product [Heligmosomoides polygyrus]
MREIPAPMNLEWPTVTVGLWSTLGGVPTSMSPIWRSALLLNVESSCSVSVVARSVVLSRPSCLKIWCTLVHSFVPSS